MGYGDRELVGGRLFRQQPRVVVTGATGYIGGRLIPVLLDHGFSVRALARSPEKLTNVQWRNLVEVVRADLSDEESLARAFAGIDVVYYLVHSMGTARDFEAAERHSAENVASAARLAGVRRIVYLGGLHPREGELSKHLSSRTAVAEILIASGIETVVLQAGVVVGSGSASFEMIRHLTDRLPVMTTPKWVRNKIQPIAISDVLSYLVGAATCVIRESRSWDIGGPDVLEYGDMMRIYAQVAGLRARRIVVLPVLTPRIAALWVGLVTPIPSGLARPLVESLHCDAVMDNNDIDSIIPPPPGGLTPYRSAVTLALARVSGAALDDGYSRAAAAQPGDPGWAGQAAHIDTCSLYTSVSPGQLWKIVEAAVPRHWQVEDSVDGQMLRLWQRDVLGERWLEVRVIPEGGGSRYEQQSTFYPRGLLGEVYWIVGRPVSSLMRRAAMHRVIAVAGTSRL